MNAREQGFLLLTSHLGDPQRKVLTVPQLRLLAKSVSMFDFGDEDRAVCAEDLMALGYTRESAKRIVFLLSETERLQWYLQQGKRQGFVPVTRVSAQYPLILRKRLGLDSPGCLWAKGDLSLLESPMVALVGSRELHEENMQFARNLGAQAARQGFTLVSGNAKGADRTAQEACLTAGGNVVCVLADELQKYPEHDNVLYLAEDGYDLPFSAQRALSRNRVIHALGRATFVAQCTLGQGGTWDGTLYNLKHTLSPVFCFVDDSDASRELEQRGAVPVRMDMLEDIGNLKPKASSFIDDL